ncbi:MAG: phage tail tape measure protein, partial [Lachnospiraceae bacterium]|nr:phage tail tape measure protein [Lachnospiraceae bacterium]
MAEKIRGITIELGGDASGLSKALKDVNSEIKDTQAQLKDVERLLKLDPKNTELLAQKQKLLGNQISNATSKLETLKQAQATMDANGVDKNSDQYMALQREIISTETELKSLKTAAKDTA